MDLKGAYTLISFRPEDVHLLTMEMTEGLAMVFLCGVFGWTGTPAAFQVITRALVWELRRVLSSSLVMYVDDIIAVSLAGPTLAQDMRIAQDLCVGLLEDNAVQIKKTIKGHRLPAIGYTFDLTHSLVTVSRPNSLRAFYGFFTVNVRLPVKVIFKSVWLLGRPYTVRYVYT